MKTCLWYSLFIWLNLLTHVGNSQSTDPLKDRIEKIVIALKYVNTSDGIDDIISIEETIMLYEERAYLPLWWNDGEYNVHIDEAINLLKSAYDEGLDPSDFHYEELVDLMTVIHHKEPAKVSLSRKVALEMLLTDGLLTYATHLYAGKTNPESFDPHWHAEGKELVINYYGYLLNAISSNTLTESYEKLRSTNQGYFELKKALRYYRQLRDTHVAFDVLDYPLAMDKETPLKDRWIGQKLVSNGDLNEAYISHPDSILAALIRFKKRHGLAANNDLDAAAIEALQIRLDDRIHTILANMERWRWLPNSLENDYVVVNIANFDLRVIVSGVVKMKTRVIVGKIDRQTPVLSQDILGVIIYPTWTVPPTILKEDILPLGNGIPDYLIRNRIEVLNNQGQVIHPDSIDWQNGSRTWFPYMLRQQSGVDNALGTIKFIMSSRMLIYLHDTPSKSLFNQQERAFSAGCIRVQRPYDLAQLLFKIDQNMDEGVLDKLRQKQETKRVWLRKPWKAYILYWTSWVDADGTIHFRKDIYNRDKRLIEAL